ncbi:MAG: MFS transporter, partial [Desulfococcaceae bacterium]
KEKLPLVNSFQMASGGLGALAATAPVEAALHIADWRQIFLVLGGLTLLTGVLVYRIVPPRPAKGEAISFADSVRGIGRVLSGRTFWRIAPWTALSQASFLSIHGLWAGPWLRDVAGFDREAAAGALLLLAAAILAGYLAMGALAERLGRRGIPPMSVAAGGMIVFMVNLLLIAKTAWPWPIPAWLVYGFFGTSGILPYAVLSQRFPVNLSGRVNTALNLLVFVSAFAAQWGVGAVIGLWIPPGPDRYAPDGYAAAFALLTGLQAVAAIWFFLSGDWERKRPVAGE